MLIFTSKLFFLLLAINVDVDLFIVKTHVACDGRGFSSGVLVPPNQVFVLLSVDDNIVIFTIGHYCSLDH